ncbi:MAG6090-like repeat-containing lipoprotein [Mycoplasma mycoides]|uniref:Lipoprotein n=1 Tax=Mycoplasma mycoides subsp. capri TaxID=40477 RepID=A0AB38GE31_MYCMC|nr:lipoprotein [Mycoplasma mycoides]ACU78329.1 putative liporotein [Mycoplasma mycoides subsp. capri str. GM12]ACU79158.1 putative liporotein [Mycoplasma mycoides subsp. capri str. GM12]SRX58345.1 lipoprotein [Mycoplasma mycoides subsp. capri]SRX60879.1 lipoprotein [Mycoplasma mycoides subsp. capri]SRX62826.1 lipoprotein [Mycoplasma mycoides subsp. capri]
MKKLLTILGPIMISTSGATLVVACKTPATKQPTNSNENTNQNEPTKPSEKDKDQTDPKKPVEPTNPSNKPENNPTKPSKKDNEKPNSVKPKPATISWNSIFRDSATGADINLNPTKQDLEKEEKRLEELVKNILKDNKKVNDEAFNKFIKEHKDWWNKFVKDLKIQIYRDSVSGLDINLNPTKEQLERENERLDKWVKEYLEKNKKENQALLDYLIKTKIDEIFRDSPTGLDINFYLTEEQIDTENKKQEQLIKEILDKNYKDNFANLMAIKASQTVKELFSDEFSNLVKAAIKNRFIKTYSDSITGADINFYLTKEQLEKEVKDILDKNYSDNYARFLEHLASRDTNKLFNDEYTDLIKAVLKNRFTKTYSDSITGDDISWSPTKDQIENHLSTLTKEIEKQLLEKEENESEFGKKEDSLNNLFETTLMSTKKQFEEGKARLDQQIKEYDKKINDLLEQIKQEDTKDKKEKEEENLKELTEWLELAKELENEYVAIEKVYDEKVQEAISLNSKIEQTEQEIKKNKEVASHLDEIKEKISQQEKTYKKDSEEQKSLAKEISEEIKLLESYKKDLVSETDFYDSFFYSNRKDYGFNHEFIDHLTEEIKESSEVKEQLEKNIQEIEEANTKISTKLNKEKQEAEKAKTNVDQMTQSLDQMNKKKTEIDTYLRENNDEISKIKDFASLYKNDVRRTQGEIEDSKQKLEELTKKVSEFESQLSQLEMQKSQIQKSISELEKSTNRVISEVESNYKKDLLELDNESNKKEKEINSKIKKLQKMINKLEEKKKQLK